MIAIGKILFDLSFYYALSGYFLHIIAADHPSVWGVLFLMLPVAIYTALESRIRSMGSAPDDAHGTAGILLKVACSAIPGLHFIFSLSIGQAIQFLPAWIYVMLAIWNNAIYTDRNKFESHFKFTAKLYLTMILGVLARGRMGDAITAAIPFVIAYLMTGICLMRTLREEGKLKAGRNISIVFAILLSGATLAYFRTPQLIFGAAGFIYQNIIFRVILIIAYAIGMLFYGIYWVLSAIFSLFTGDLGYAQTAQDGGMAQPPFGEEVEAALVQLPAWAGAAFTFLFIAAVIILSVLIMRRLLGGRIRAPVTPYYSEERERLKGHDKSDIRTIFRPKDPRQAVRWYYRKYLKEGASRGAQPEPSDTSLGILRKYGKYFPQEESRQLRDLYIRARYRFGGEILKEQSAEASKIWREIK
jgi:predicted secreted protein